MSQNHLDFNATHVWGFWHQSQLKALAGLLRHSSETWVFATLLDCPGLEAATPQSRMAKTKATQDLAALKAPMEGT